MTDTRDLHDDGLRALVRAAGAPAGIDFRADLRARLAAAIDGDVELDPVEPSDYRRTWLPIVAAAAVVALVVGTIALIARDRDPEVVPSTDLATQLVGRTWVALDTGVAGRLPTLQMKIGTTRPDVIVLTGLDGCNTHRGEFRLDGTSVVDAVITQTLGLCDVETAAMPAQGTSLSINGDVLTVTSASETTVFTALESLDPVSGSELDGPWAAGPARIQITDGQVTSDADRDGISIDLARALTVGTAESWMYDESLIVRTPTTGLFRLDPAGPVDPAEPAPATLLDELVGRTWVGVGGDWQTAAPTLVFDSLNREPGLSAVSVFDGCNTGEGTFVLDGATMVATEIGMTKIGCSHSVAGLADGTNLAVTDGTNLAVTDTDGLTTFYVALDSLEPVPDTDLPAALDGVWEFAGSVFTIDGDTIGSQGSAPTAVWELVSGVVHADGVEAWRRESDLVLRNGSTFVVLVRSDLPSGGSPVVTTGRLDMAEEALILGTVTLEDGCLVTTLDGIRYPLVWQPGTSWNGVDTVILPDGVNLPMGQAIEAGGGYHSADGLEGFGIDAAGIETMRGCAERIGPEIAVIQSPVTPRFPGADGE